MFYIECREKAKHKMRRAFGLYTDREDDKPHWHGAFEPDVWKDRCDSEESCVLLTRPVTAVRGFLETARRAAEAGW
jgi:hypothetical protein